ncbi:MAG: 16S rRNA (adenine(1518)-N(6)/adenine(1519)-N(6))-dimethyltransferase RsmA [Clostridia bacterium]|nr:16S rRNA (adenine(1518)-N(6)/adenine(1519)-N(6))-dimethyltransferase RsmA [Clostridia bacterium]
MNTGFRKKKQYGQNFLTNSAIPRRIAQESGITKEDGVIEIGPGFGILTRELCAAAKKVVSVEIDGELTGILNEKLADAGNFKLINADILELDIKKLISEEFDGMEVCVCANLPYYITSEIVMKLLEGGYGFRSITVMVQKEVAERFTSLPGSKNFGAVTAAISYYAKVKKLFTVKAGSFDPKPKVDSAVIRFDVYKKPPVEVNDEKTLFAVIRAAFSQRRKTLANSLYSGFAEKYSKEEIAGILLACGVDPNARPEVLGIEQFAGIANSF